MKFLKALAETSRKKDDTPMERLDYNRVRATIEEYCNTHLKNSEDIFQFESLPSAIDATLACLESPQFLEKYEFSQVSETLFIVRMKELNIF